MSGVRQEGLYLCVQEMHQQGHAIAEICDILDLNRSSYYKWTHRTKSIREIENEALLHDIGMIYAEHNGTYGYRRIADEYNETHEKKYNLKRFYRLVHIVGLLAIIRRKRPAYQRSKPEVTAENILNREFTADKVNEKWCTDVTEMKFGSDGEKAYLSAILDLKSRDIVSFAIGKSNNNQLVFETFDLAIQKYPDAHPLFHSDRGFQYTSKLFKTKLDKQKMVQSMSRVGRCIDNGPMEGFWGILKCERPHREFCVSDFRQNQEYHVFNVQDEGLFPLSTPVPEGWDGMRAVCGVNAGAACRESYFKGISPPSGR